MVLAAVVNPPNDLLQINRTDRESRRIPIHLAGGNCTGEEATLAECPGSGLGGSTSQCGIADIVSLSCFKEHDPGEPYLVHAVVTAPSRQDEHTHVPMLLQPQLPYNAEQMICKLCLMIELTVPASLHRRTLHRLLLQSWRDVCA